MNVVWLTFDSVFPICTSPFFWPLTTHRHRDASLYVEVHDDIVIDAISFRRSRLYDSRRLGISLPSEPVHDLVTSGGEQSAGHFVYAEEGVWKRCKSGAV